jgi:hypothetical protein
MPKTPPLTATAEMIASIVGDPKSPRALRTVRGYVGDSWRAGHLRVYFDLAFQAYVDIPQADVVQSKSLGDAGPLEATFLWVNLEADIHYSPNIAGPFPGPITELSCPPQTIHSDCPTPTFNTAGCGFTEGSCGSPTQDGCGATEFGCDVTEDCLAGRRRARRRYW